MHVGATGIAGRLTGPLALQTAASASAVAAGALWSFIALLLSAAAALLGGCFGMVARLCRAAARSNSADRA
jgi:hypothetical protein